MNAFVDSIAVPAMLILGGIAFLTAIGGIVGFVLATNKVKQAVYWWRILGGVSYISLSGAGAFAVGYISEGRTMTQVCVVLFLFLGIWLLNLGLKLRTSHRTTSQG